MKRLVLCLLAALALPNCLYALDWEEGPLGRTAIVPMENAPYPHESRAEGYTYQETFFSAEEHYSDSSVALFIPKGYTPGDTVDLLYYFHGWGNNVEKSLDQYRLREMVVASGKNVILVFPEGPRNASDSGLGKLEDPEGLKNLTDEVLKTLKDSGATTSDQLGSVILSGHSGAYRGIAFSLHQGGLDDYITDVYLLDASYANLDYFIEWMMKGGNRRLRSIFTDHLAADNTAMMAALSRAEIPFEVRLDTEIEEGLLERAAFVFVYTKERDHNQAVEILELFLATSR